MEASTLAIAHPGRFTLGIGHGVPAWVQGRSAIHVHLNRPLSRQRHLSGDYRLRPSSRAQFAVCAAYSSDPCPPPSFSDLALPGLGRPAARAAVRPSWNSRDSAAPDLTSAALVSGRSR